MLDLPAATELHKPLPKKALYTKFRMNTAAKERIDADISRITIVNEVTPDKVHIVAGEQIKSFFVVLLALKRKDFDEKGISLISKLIPQKMLFVLECGNEEKLAVYHTKLMQTSWKPKGSFSLPIKGLNLDKVWDNAIVHVGEIQIESGNTLDEQIAIDERRKKIEKDIRRLEILARKEKQPKRKFELVQEIMWIKNGADE